MGSEGSRRQNRDQVGTRTRWEAARSDEWATNHEVQAIKGQSGKSGWWPSTTIRIVHVLPHLRILPDDRRCLTSNLTGPHMSVYPHLMDEERTVEHTSAEPLFFAGASSRRPPSARAVLPSRGINQAGAVWAGPLEEQGPRGPAHTDSALCLAIVTLVLGWPQGKPSPAKSGSGDRWNCT